MPKELKILTIKDKKEELFLRKKSKDVTKEEFPNSEFQAFLDDLVFTAYEVETEDGYSAAGLAAIQVGVDKRVFCILREDTGTFEIMINPVIKPVKHEQVVGLEGCLSVPNKEGKVSRLKKIKVKFQDRNGNIKKGIYSNQEAREIQHEYDHTQGVLFIDKLVD